MVTYPNISGMQGYGGTDVTVDVTDPLLGGIFNYFATGYVPQNGIAYAATTKGSGFWVRQFNIANGVNITWFGAQPLTGANPTYDNASSIMSAFAYLTTLGGGICGVPPGTFMSSEITMPGNILFRGASSYNYGVSSDSACIIKRIPDTITLIDASSAENSSLRDLEINGNAGDSVPGIMTLSTVTGTFAMGDVITGSVSGAIAKVVTGGTTSITAQVVYSEFNHLEAVTASPSGATGKFVSYVPNADAANIGVIIGSNTHAFAIQFCKVNHFDTGFNGKAESGALILDSVFRNNNTGVANLRDAQIGSCTFSGNSVNGIYLNNGQVSINDSFFEFTRTNYGGGNAIQINGYSARIMISNNKFDRNGSTDILVTSVDGMRAQRIIISGNQFKRAGWKIDINVPSQVLSSCAINANDCDGITVVSNDFFFQGGGASSEEGIISPVHAIAFNGCTETMERSNNYYGNHDKLDLAGGTDNAQNFSWVQSTANPYAWILQDLNSTIIPPGGKAGNPYIIIPDNVEYRGSYVTVEASPAVLVPDVNGQWAWGNIAADGLGYDSIYLVLPSGGTDPDPYDVPANLLFAYFDQQMVVYNDTFDCATNADRDFVQGILNLTTTIVNVSLKTRQAQSTYTRMPYILRISGCDKNVTPAHTTFYDISIVLKRLAGTQYPVVQIGEITAYISDLIVYVNGTGTMNGVNLKEFSTDGICSELNFTMLTEPAPASFVYTAELLW
jgi:hypothetical protein